MNCKEALEPSAAACVECGTQVGAFTGATPPAAIASSSAPQLRRNKITYREDRNSRSIDADFSDATMVTFGDVLSDIFGNQGAVAGQRQGNSRLFSQEPPEVAAGKSLAAPPPSNGSLPVVEGRTAQPSAHDDLTNILKVFKLNGEALALDDNRLKAKNGMDYVRRLTYLFLYAHELHDRDWTPKASVIEVLKEGKVWDPNASRWLSKKQGFREDGEERLQLVVGGRDDAKKALLEVMDPKVTDNWNPDKKTPQKRGRRKKKEKA
jgi:hypothetical protein